MAARSGVAVIGNTRVAGRCGANMGSGVHELHDRAARFAGDLAYEIESLPEVQNLRHGTTRGIKMQGVTARDKILTGIAIAGSTIMMIAAYLVVC